MSDEDPVPQNQMEYWYLVIKQLEKNHVQNNLSALLGFLKGEIPLDS